MNERQGNHQDRSETAVSRRLAKLRDVPVEATAFDASFEAVMQEESGRLHRIFIGSQYRALAASIALLLTIGAVLAAFTFSAQPARASEQRLAEIYQNSVAQHGGSMAVHSIEEARAALRRKWAGAPEIPEADAEELHVMSCCVHEVGRKQMASITFLADGSPVTAAVAKSGDIRPPSGQTYVRGGVKYLTSSSGGVNMAMHERGGLWTCVMGKLPVDRLIELLESLQSAPG